MKQEAKTTEQLNTAKFNKLSVLAWLRRPKSWFIIGGGVAIVLLLTLLSAFLLTTRGAVTVGISGANEPHEVDRPIMIKFSQQLGSVTPAIAPAVEGAWHEKRRLFGLSELEFRPAQQFAADTEYTISFTDTRRVLFGEAQLVTQKFRTQKTPSIKSTSLDGKDVIAMDQALSVRLGSRAGRLRDLELAVEPAVAGLKRHSVDDRTFTWKYQGNLSADTEYTFVLKDNIQKEELKRVKIKTAPLPVLATPVKETSVTPADELKIVFGEAIEGKDRPAIKFGLDGSGDWRSDTEYIFKPAKLEPGKTYTYTLPKGLRTVRGGILQEPIERNFTTNGRVQAIGVWPYKRVVNQAVQDIKITFNQAVDHKSAETRFRVSSGRIKGFYWQGNALVARVADMGFQQHVQAWVEPGVVPAFGLTNTERIATTFTTDSRVIKLNVPYYTQAYKQSCEAASLRMALAYRGIHDSDWNILQRFGYNPRPRDKERNIWDDPTIQFVGDVNGNQGDGTGWGVYAGPVSRAAGQYGRGTSVAYGANAHFVAQQIHAGNPVIAWGVWRLGTKIDTWTTPSGKVIRGPTPMHVRLIVGVKGEPHDPIGFYVNDPISGRLYWTKSQFISMTSGAGPAAQLLAVR